MMKTLCVAVVVLSLTSVCQPASLACEKLLKPVDKGPDLSGGWYLIAISSDVCLVTTLLNSVFWPSFAVDVTSKDTPNIYDVNFKVKMYGYCTNETEQYFYEKNNIFSVSSNNTPSGEPDVLLQSGCPDCIVVKDTDIIDTLMLYSRRKTVTAAELKEFETQTECLGWPTPQVLNTDHEYENCPALDDDDDDTDTSRLSLMMYQRLKNVYTEPLKCLAYDFLYYPRLAYEWVRQEWDNIWPF
ncbi:uncharacterized protein LOC119885660 [Micropterus salmoides]|uniref:uncharacterized protein LOC119885660 n=1 Tax=Micropterus salmoides TaxID=27706 RepID=UPI0018EAAF71|nr:uncharacterized protein LOC119885660 [Micropterus salmoides]